MGTEGGDVPFVVSLDRAAPKDGVEFYYATLAGTASVFDFKVVSAGRMAIAPGATSAKIKIKALTDSSTEGNEYFSLLIFDANDAIIERPAAVGTITDVRAGIGFVRQTARATPLVTPPFRLGKRLLADSILAVALRAT